MKQRERSTIGRFGVVKVLFRPSNRERYRACGESVRLGGISQEVAA